MNIKNILNFFKTEEEIRQSMSLKEIVPILKQNLVEIKNNDEVVIFKVTKIKKSGFEVKVKGIFAFVPFSLMPWKYYPNMWGFMANEIINHKFFAKIVDLDLAQNRIILDATVTEFDEFLLSDGQTYKAIILKKSKNFIIVEIGHRYNWTYGSQAFYITLDSPNYIEIDYAIHSISDEIDLTYIQSANNWKRIKFDRIVTEAQPIQTLEIDDPSKAKPTSAIDVLSKKYEKLELKFENVKNQNSIQQEKLTELKTTNKDLRQQIYEVTNNNKFLEKQVVLLTNQVLEAINLNGSKKNVLAMTKTIEDLKAEIASLHKKVLVLETALERKAEMIKTQENWISQLQNKS